MQGHLTKQQLYDPETTYNSETDGSISSSVPAVDSKVKEMLDSKSHSTAMCPFKAGKLLFCPSTLDPVRLSGLQQCASSNRNRAQSLRTCEMLQQEVDFQCLDNANSWTLLKFKSSLGLYSGVLSSFYL